MKGTGKRILALALAAVMALMVCGCGKADGSGQDSGAAQGGTEQNEGIGGASGGGAGGGSAAEDGTANPATSDRVFWVEVIGPDQVNICLRDESVNQMRSEVYSDGSSKYLNEITVRFFADGTEKFECTLTAGGKGARLSEDWDTFYETSPLDDFYENDTVCWTVKCDGIAELLRKCDTAWGRYVDDADSSNSRMIFEIGGSQELAGVFTDVEGREKTEGIRLAFDGDMVYVELAGESLVKAAKEKAPVLWLGTADESKVGDSSPDSPYSIHFSAVKENGGLYGAWVDGYEYTGEGAGFSTAPKEAWSEVDEKHIAIWFYAPGFERAAKALGEYYFECWGDGEHSFVGSSGNMNEIMGSYKNYTIPEIPAEYLVDEREADAEYFTPLTPYYSITRYDYPEIPMTVDFQWYLINPLGPEYGHMSMDTATTSCTRLVLRSYNAQGVLVQHLEKCVYENEEAAVRTSVYRHNPLRTATGQTYGTEADFAEWIYEDFLKSCDGYLLSHDGNVVYYSGSAYAFAADDMWISGVEDVYSQPKTQSGSIPYSYAHGHTSRETGESACSYRSYCTFDFSKVRGE